MLASETEMRNSQVYILVYDTMLNSVLGKHPPLVSQLPHL